MAPEGMVHALEQMHRVLRPNGLLADLRANRFIDLSLPPALPQVYGISDDREILVGELEKSPENLAYHRAANRAVDEVLHRGLYALEATAMFPFRYYFRSLARLDGYIRTTWRATSLGAAVRLRLEGLLDQDPQGRILVVDPLRLHVMRKRRQAVPSSPVPQFPSRGVVR